MEKTDLPPVQSEPPKAEDYPVPQFESEPSEFTTQSILAVISASGLMFCTVGFANAFGVFQEYYVESLNESASNVAWLGAISIFILYAGSLFTGPILDLFGPVIMFWVGSFGTIFSLMMTSLCTEYWQFILAQGVLFGLAMSLLVTPCVALVSQYFRKRRAAAVGVVIAGSSLGGVLWPIIVQQLLLKKNIGFPWTMRISGFIMLLIMSVSCLICRPMPKPEPKGTPNDSEAETQQGKQVEPGQRHGGWDWTIIKRPVMLLTAVGYFFACFGLLTPLFFVTSYAVEKGFPQNLSFYSISIANGGSVFGRILPGLVADRYGKFNSCIIMMLLSGVIAFCWTTATSVAGLVVFSAAYGFASGGILSLQQACAAQVATPATIGTAIGFVMASASLSTLAGTPISGALASKYGYLSVSIYTGVSLIIGAVFLILSRLVQNRKLLAVV